MYCNVCSQYTHSTFTLFSFFFFLNVSQSLDPLVRCIIVLKHSLSLKLTRGAGLGYANVAGIIRVYLEITRFQVHIARRWKWRGGSGLDGYRQSFFMARESLRLDDVGGEARGAGLVEVLGKDWAPLGAM